MISYLADAILLAALLATTLQMLSVRRELRRLRAEQEDYRRAIASSATALADAKGLVELLNCDGRTVAETLGTQIDWARALLHRFDALAAIVNQRAMPAQRESRTAAQQGTLIHDRA